MICFEGAVMGLVTRQKKKKQKTPISTKPPQSVVIFKNK